MRAHAHEGIPQGVIPFFLRKASDSRYASTATRPPITMKIRMPGTLTLSTSGPLSGVLFATAPHRARRPRTAPVGQHPTSALDTNPTPDTNYRPPPHPPHQRPGHKPHPRHEQLTTPPPTPPAPWTQTPPPTRTTDHPPTHPPRHTSSTSLPAGSRATAPCRERRTPHTAFSTDRDLIANAVAGTGVRAVGRSSWSLGARGVGLEPTTFGLTGHRSAD